MNSAILNTVIQEFISNNILEDTTTLLLKKHDFVGVTIKEVIEQIEAKKRCKVKLPTWYNTSAIYYPNKLNIEQTSSEVTAKFKSKIIVGNSLIDLTGGFGVDCYYFSKVFKEVTHCELNNDLAKIADHNFKELGVSNINSVNVDGIAYLTSSKKKFDCIFIDPSRRNDVKGKVVYLKDCIPNVPEHLEKLFNHSKQILIKTSPMLDISVAISELRYTKEIHVVAVNNEVKEVLYLLEKGFNDQTVVRTIDLRKDNNLHFDFILADESKANATIGKIQNYLYVPNAAIMKAGAFKSISEKLNISKLHQHSHIYTSDTLIDFPGRSFKIYQMLPYNKRKIKSILEKQQFNVATRNFPESVAQLKKKFKFKDGGKDYVFFTTSHNDQKMVLFCERV